MSSHVRWWQISSRSVRFVLRQVLIDDLTYHIPFSIASWMTITQEIISEEIVDETDQYEDNQSKQHAKRLTNAAVMRGYVFALPIPSLHANRYLRTSPRSVGSSNANEVSPALSRMNVPLRYPRPLFRATACRFHPWYHPLHSRFSRRSNNTSRTTIRNRFCINTRRRSHNHHCRNNILTWPMGRKGCCSIRRRYSMVL